MTNTISTQTAQRPKRTPVSNRNVLTAPTRKGYVRRFVTDTEDRISVFEEGGWQIVRGDIPVGDKAAGRDSSLGSPVTKHVGGGQKAYLMEIKEDWFNEDQYAKQQKIQETVDQIVKNRDEGQYGSITVSNPAK